MDKQKPLGSFTFRPQGKGQELIGRASKVGVNVTKVLNDLLDKHGAAFFEPAIKTKKKEVLEMLETV